MDTEVDKCLTAIKTNIYIYEKTGKQKVKKQGQTVHKLQIATFCKERDIADDAARGLGGH